MRILGNKILVEPQAEPTRSDIIHTFQERPPMNGVTFSKVIGLGTKFTRENIHEGDTVIHSNQFGLRVPGTNFLILEDQDILAKQESATT